MGSCSVLKPAGFGTRNVFESSRNVFTSAAHVPYPGCSTEGFSRFCSATGKPQDGMTNGQKHRLKESTHSQITSPDHLYPASSAGARQSPGWTAGSLGTSALAGPCQKRPLCRAGSTCRAACARPGLLSGARLPVPRANPFSNKIKVESLQALVSEATLQ